MVVVSSMFCRFVMLFVTMVLYCDVSIYVFFCKGVYVCDVVYLVLLTVV